MDLSSHLVLDPRFTQPATSHSRSDECLHAKERWSFIHPLWVQKPSQVSKIRTWCDSDLIVLLTASLTGVAGDMEFFFFVFFSGNVGECGEVRSCTARVCGVFGDVRRCAEMDGDAWRCAEMCKDMWRYMRRCAEMCGDVRRCAEMCRVTYIYIYFIGAS